MNKTSNIFQPSEYRAVREALDYTAHYTDDYFMPLHSNRGVLLAPTPLVPSPDPLPLGLLSLGLHPPPDEPR